MTLLGKGLLVHVTKTNSSYFLSKWEQIVFIVESKKEVDG